jgi:hypothetical protein
MYCAIALADVLPVTVACAAQHDKHLSSDPGAFGMPKHIAVPLKDGGLAAANTVYSSPVVTTGLFSFTAPIKETS